ncbi:MAG: hypothetical protein ABI282_04750 [Candidatus Baltobacteraceae bacterium]
MKSALRIAFAATALTLALGACQGGFGGSGTAAPGGVNPPVSEPAPGSLNPTPEPTITESAAPSIGPGDVTYAVASGPKGLACPQQNGFTCTLYLNLSDAQFAALTASPSPAPSAKGAKHSPTPSPTPTPTPTPDENADESGSPSPSPSPTAAGAQVKISLASLPKDAPSMVNPNPKAIATVSLVTLRLITTDDVTLSGHASVQFTLPKEQIGGRGFAIQLFHETVGRKNKRSDQFIGSYSQSKIDDNKLAFSFASPKIIVKKGETWLFVLYGDELPSASASPSPSGSPRASSSPGASGSPVASSSPSASPSASPQP